MPDRSLFKYSSTYFKFLTILLHLPNKFTLLLFETTIFFNFLFSPYISNNSSRRLSAYGSASYLTKKNKTISRPHLPNINYIEPPEPEPYNLPFPLLSGLCVLLSDATPPHTHICSVSHSLSPA